VFCRIDSFPAPEVCDRMALCRQFAAGVSCFDCRRRDFDAFASRKIPLAVLRPSGGMPDDSAGFFSSKKTCCPHCSAERRKSRLALLLVTVSVALSQCRKCTRVSSHAAVHAVNLEEHHDLFMAGNMFFLRIASRDRHCKRLASGDGQDFAMEDACPTLVGPAFLNCLRVEFEGGHNLQLFNPTTHITPSCNSCGISWETRMDIRGVAHS
jgi:hypothetical protein